MSYRYLLDTNILSDLIRNPQDQASQHLKRIKPQTICTSILVACELSFGAQKRNAPALSDRIASLLDRIPVLPLDLPAHQHYSTLHKQSGSHPHPAPQSADPAGCHIH